LCLPSATALSGRLRKLGANRFLPVYPTMPEARAAIASRLPLTDRLQTRLPPTSGSARAARDLVDRACEAWSLTDLRHPARLVVSELVTNAIEHAGTELSVTVSRRGTRLHLSVRDGDPRPPLLRDPNSGPSGHPDTDYRGRGLRIVHAAAAAWGSMPTPDGKRVWATLRPAK
jgi:anti-sigma regulatory factor (Ser/Thr protein kinase)